MSLCIEIDDIVKFSIKGSFANRTGKDESFSFTLVCERVESDVVEAFIRSSQQEEAKLIDFFLAEGADPQVNPYRTQDWSGITTKAGAPVPFSEAELRKVFRMPGIPMLVWRRYLEEIQAKAKN